MVIKNKQNLFVLFLMICLIFPSFGPTVARVSGAESDAVGKSSAAPAAFSDLNNHWAENILMEWMKAGLIEGYSDGTFKPDRTINRGEALALVNRAFGFSEKADIDFSDLSISDWEYEEAAKAVQAGYIDGYADGTIRTKQSISRQEAAVIIARLLELDVQAGDAAVSSFTDAQQIPQWSKGAVAAVAAAQIMEGYEDGSFKPLASITRAEVVVTLERALRSSEALEYNQAGTYGSAGNDVQTISGNVVVHVSGVTLQNMKITGDLLLAEGIAEGDVFLKNVTVLGTTTVKGGGMNSIHVEDSVLAIVVIDKAASVVRIVAKDNTVIAEVIVKSPVILEQTESDSLKSWIAFPLVKLMSALSSGSVITLNGRFDHVEVEAKTIVIEFTQGEINQMSVTEQATGTSIQVDKNAKIVSLIVNAIAKLLGQGMIEKATLSEKAKGTTFEKQPRLLEGAGAPNSGWSGSAGIYHPDPEDPASVPIVENGQPKAVVIVPAEAAEPILDAAETLSAYVKKSTGAELPAITELQLAADEQLYSRFTKIYVGTTRAQDLTLYKGLLEGMNEDGFVLDSREGIITILGSKSHGTQYGVYEFLERYAGVRWLMPGADGEDVPQRTDLYVPIADVRDEPAYLSRVMFPLQYYDVAGSNPTQFEWGARNRLRLQNSGWEHNVWRFFPTSPEYLAAHPDYFTQKNGVPSIPGPNWGWQPCYSNPDTIQVAVDWILNYFNTNPNEPSASLAVNDNGSFCEENPVHPHYTSKKNSLSLTDMSDIYYSWVNEVVTRVLAADNGKFADKWFGLLAYQEVYDPPSFPLHERVVPYLAKDRMAWSDSAVKAKDQSTVDKWKLKAEHIGFYDYTYGSPYALPRVYNNLMADMFKYGADNKANAYFAELFPNWGEGPKAWLMAKLMWNPEQNADDLLADWYNRAVGAEAAPYLKAYYDHWNDFWENRIKQTGWFDGRKNTTYFNFDSPAYLSIVTDAEIAQSRSLLETVVTKAVTNQQKARANNLLRAFEYYEASALSYPKAIDQLQNTSEALDLLEKSVDFESSMAYAKKRLALLEQFKSDPLLQHPLYNASTFKLKWSGLNADAFWKLVAYLKAETAGGAVRQRAEELAASGSSPTIRNYAHLLLTAADGAPVNLNASFEEASDTDNGKVTAKHWDANILNYGKFEQKIGPSTSGTASVYVKNFYYGDMNQTVAAQSGLVISRLNYYVSDDIVSIGDIWLELNLLDEHGQKLATIKSDQQPFYNSMGRWETIQIMDVIPSRINGIPVKSINMSATVNGFFEGGTLYLDDFELYQAPEPGEVPVLASAEADNGTVRVIFNETPEQAPVLSDFTVKRIDTSDAVMPSALQWNSETLTAALTVPGIASVPWEQQVMYEVTYDNQDLIRTNSLTIVRQTGYTSVMTNSSFEQWTGANVDGWWFLGEGFVPSDTIKRSGQYALTVNGFSVGQNLAGGGGPIQDMAALQPGKYVGVFHYLTEAQTAGTLKFILIAKDATGAEIATIPATVTETAVPGAASGGKWRTASFTFNVDAEYGGKLTAAGRVILLMENFKDGERVYLDDVELIRKDDAPSPALVSAEAENGKLRVIMNAAPEEPPVVTDFTIKRGDSGDAVTPTEVQWHAETLTATLTVPNIAPLPWEQHVVYEIAYGSEDIIPTNAVLISRQAGYTSVMTNSSFEQWTGADTDGWWFLGEGFEPSSTVKRSGQKALTVNGFSEGQNLAGGGGPVQDMAALQPGEYVGVFHYLTEAQTEGTLKFILIAKDATGAQIATIPATVTETAVPGGASGGKWRTASFTFNVAAQYDGKLTAAGRVILLMENFQIGERIYLDDVELILQN
ncbi:DUF4838 domain-containing protein [Paenibacillus eucommiae]|uniref:SLH domain-containing protein n=1 Tax=Paenibacillus eucommiae TaxID=1355755 RepID=A0ABS4J403_9BACL|nr:DUF4838 domain-containing protein [Paenibacillus eucommiae]MBP1993821.1 hypothetical protein [Paenibacillus eucommiae]